MVGVASGPGGDVTCQSSEEVDWGAAAGGVVEHGELQSEQTDRAVHQDTLLREMQHRVANSLQILAGILLLKARTVRSEDAHLHLLDAYGRVMSVAAVQRQLLEMKQSGMIRLSDYLAELGRILAKSLTDKVNMSVVVDSGAAVESHRAVAMGLIVTELVMNAIRHAFPGDRAGRVVIAYKAAGSDWTLSVSDDGVGQSNSVKTAGSGYGTKIIDALTQQLDAHVEVKSGSQGTRVSVIHASEIDVDQRYERDSIRTMETNLAFGQGHHIHKGV